MSSTNSDYKFLTCDSPQSLIGLGGTLLAPFSGGLSAVAAAAAIGTSGYTIWSNHRSNKNVSEENKKALRETEAVMKRFDLETEKLLKIVRTIVSFDKMEITAEVCDIVFRLSRAAYTILSVNPNQNRAMFDTSTGSDNTPLSAGVIGSAGRLISNAMSSPADIIQFTITTEKVMHQTSICRQILHSAKAVNKMTSELPVARVLEQVRAGMSAHSAGARSASSLLTTFGHSRQSANAAFTVGQRAINAAASAQRASLTTRGTREFALGTQRAMRTSIVTKTVKETSNVSVTATKAASINKLGVAMSVIAIPLDVYNIINLETNTPTTPEEVQRIRDAANTLRHSDTLEEYIVTIEAFEEMHIEIYKVYEKHRVEKLYEFLEMCHKKLNLQLPSK